MSDRAQTYLSDRPAYRTSRPLTTMLVGKYRGKPLFEFAEQDEWYPRWAVSQQWLKYRFPQTYRELRRVVARVFEREIGEQRARDWFRRSRPAHVGDRLVSVERAAAWEADTRDTVDKFVDAAQLLAGVARTPGGGPAFILIKELLDTIERRSPEFIDSEV